MSNMLPRFPDNAPQQTKSFWKRPEGKTGMIVLALAAFGLIYMGGPMLIAGFGILTTLLGQAIAATAMAAALAVLLMVVTNKRVHTLTKVLFQRTMRWITGWIVEIDPIGIMRSYIEDLSKKQSVIEESIDALNGQQTKCANQIDKNQEQYENEMNQAKLAKEKGMTAAATIAARQAMRLSELNEKRLKPLSMQMQAHLKMLRKYSEVTTIIRTDLQNEINIQEQQLSMITTSFNAISAAKRIIQGGGEERAMFDMAMENVANDYGMKLGAIESFIEGSRGFMESMDLQNGVYEAEAMNRLAEWEAQADQILLAHDTQASELSAQIAKFEASKSKVAV